VKEDKKEPPKVRVTEITKYGLATLQFYETTYGLVFNETYAEDMNANRDKRHFEVVY